MKPKAYADNIPVYCAHDDIVDLLKIVPRPNNPNHHPESQIELLARIIKAQGWRAPITISNQSGFIVRGHGRLLAAQRMGVTVAPVDHQDYATEADEWADLLADNRLSELSDIDLSEVKSILDEIGDIDIDLTGYDIDELLSEINKFEPVYGEPDDPLAEWEGMPEFHQEDKLGVQQIIVHFETLEDVKAFAELVKQKITEKTKYIWYPYKEPEAYGLISDES